MRLILGLLALFALLCALLWLIDTTSLAAWVTEWQRAFQTDLPVRSAGCRQGSRGLGSRF